MKNSIYAVLKSTLVDLFCLLVIILFPVSGLFVALLLMWFVPDDQKVLFFLIMAGVIHIIGLCALREMDGGRESSANDRDEAFELQSSGDSGPREGAKSTFLLEESHARRSANAEIAAP